MSDVVIIGILLIIFAFMTYMFVLAKEFLKVRYQPHEGFDSIPMWTEKTTYHPGEESNESVFQKECVGKR
nr:MAG TPA: transmembrane cytochrome C oxidase subunit [Caudoviricetes sp.]